MGFEPMEEFDPFTHFPGELLRPLRHLSAWSTSVEYLDREIIYYSAMSVKRLNLRPSE